MNEHILLANEKIVQLSAEMQRQDFDAFLILSRQGSDGYFELLFDQTTEHLCSAKAALMRCWYIRRKRRSLPGLRM